MPTVTPDMETVYARAADLRADGWTWAATARALDLDPEELKALCRGSAVYARRLGRARRELMRDTLTESMLVLRVQLRTGDAAEGQKAAEALCRVENTFRRHRNARAKARAKVPPPDPRNATLDDAVIAHQRWFARQVDEELARLSEVYEKVDPNDFWDRNYATLVVWKRRLAGELVYPGDLPPDDPDATGGGVPNAPTDPSGPTGDGANLGEASGTVQGVPGAPHLAPRRGGRGRDESSSRG